MFEPVAGPAGPMALVGYRKDASPACLDEFPGWWPIDVERVTDTAASALRRIYFEATGMASVLTVIGNHVAPGVKGYLEAWARLPAYRQCAAEHKTVAEYRKKYTARLSLTADAVVTSKNHVLIVERGGTIGRGRGPCRADSSSRERCYAAAVRELAEETGLALPAGRLRQALPGDAVFDHFDRSRRGRIVTRALRFDLGDAPPPDVRGQDDAQDARWVPIAELAGMEQQFFEDHARILDHFLGSFPEPT